MLHYERFDLSCYPYGLSFTTKEGEVPFYVLEDQPTYNQKGQFLVLINNERIFVRKSNTKTSVKVCVFS